MTTKTMIPVFRPWLGEEEALATHAPILSGWVTQGPEVAAFEKEFAAYVGAPHACAVANCTVALQLALQVVGVGRGDEVITVSHSYIATANSIRYLDALPVFVDIEPDTVNMDPNELEAAISPKTKAILTVHQIGMPCDLTAILSVAKKHGIPVIEDAACAVGSEFRGEKIGKPQGDVVCFSFHPRKLLTTGDGGMLTTANEAYGKRFRLLRQHAMSVPDTVRHASNQVIREQFLEVGYNFRMTDIQAAVGRQQLKRLPVLLERRTKQVNEYQRLLPKVQFQREPEWAKSNWQSLMIRLPEGSDQLTVMQKLLDEGISTRRGIMCSHREPAYPAGTWRAVSDLKHSEEAQDRTILLPLFHDLSQEDLERVAHTVESLLC